ncbi:ficolin-1-like [Musca vetustissima]|uniref:ficolin-1-like n=1 Tax=Musca vetustissima TaxID=27455 RepID=UPI002AB6F8CF|nr:ficolin-1-like [Musca vetustissima]
MFTNPDEDPDRIVLWKHLFIKVNSVLAETNKVNTYLAVLDKKIDDISKRWTTILRRSDGSVNFYRDWADYKKGFGNSNQTEFFIGLDKLHALTTSSPVVELKVILRDWDGVERYALYDSFQIGNETENYEIKLLGKYNGTAGDCLSYHRGKQFSTYDKDNNDGTNCAAVFKGGWWYHKCYESHLTGPYKQHENANSIGVSWNEPEWKGMRYSFKFAEMKIRSKATN